MEPEIEQQQIKRSSSTILDIEPEPATQTRKIKNIHGVVKKENNSSNQMAQLEVLSEEGL